MILALFFACTRPPDPHYPHADVVEDTGNSGTTTDTHTDTGTTGGDTGTTPTDTGGVTHEVVPCEVNKPILLDMFRHDSVNGEYWMEPTWIMGNTSVPDLLVDGRVDHGQPTLFWMSFEDREDLCDRLAYATFNLTTNEVGAIEAVGFLDLPPTTVPETGADHAVADPDVIVVGELPTLIAMIWPETEDYYCIGVFTGTVPGSVADGTFRFQSHLLMCNEGEEENQTDPMAVFVADDPLDPSSPGIIRVLAASASAMEEENVRNYEWIVTVPDPTDPSTWYRESVEKASNQEYHAIGSIYRMGTSYCDWGMWGSLSGYVVHSCTSDFETWTREGNPNVFAADPSVAPNGTDWVMFVTQDEGYTGHPVEE